MFRETTLSSIWRNFTSSEFRFTPKADALLGKMPDDKLARRLACTAKAVTRRRERLGIVRFGTGLGESETSRFRKTRSGR